MYFESEAGLEGGVVQLNEELVGTDFGGQAELSSEGTSKATRKKTVVTDSVPGEISKASTKTTGMRFDIDIFVADICRQI